MPQVYDVDAPPGVPITAVLVRFNGALTPLQTVVCYADARGLWEFNGTDWPPPPGGNAELLNDATLQAVYGSGVYYWHLTCPTTTGERVGYFQLTQPTGTGVQSITLTPQTV